MSLDQPPESFIEQRRLMAESHQVEIAEMRQQRIEMAKSLREALKRFNETTQRINQRTDQMIKEREESRKAKEDIPPSTRVAAQDPLSVKSSQSQDPTELNAPTPPDISEKDPYFFYDIEACIAAQGPNLSAPYHQNHLSWMRDYLLYLKSRYFPDPDPSSDE